MPITNHVYIYLYLSKYSTIDYLPESYDDLDTFNYFNVSERDDYYFIDKVLDFDLSRTVSISSESIYDLLMLLIEWIFLSFQEVNMQHIKVDIDFWTRAKFAINGDPLPIINIINEKIDSFNEKVMIDNKILNEQIISQKAQLAVIMGMNGEDPNLHYPLEASRIIKKLKHHLTEEMKNINEKDKAIFCFREELNKVNQIAHYLRLDITKKSRMIDTLKSRVAEERAFSDKLKLEKEKRENEFQAYTIRMEKRDEEHKLKMEKRDEEYRIKTENKNEEWTKKWKDTAEEHRILLQEYRRIINDSHKDEKKEMDDNSSISSNRYSIINEFSPSINSIGINNKI